MAWGWLHTVGSLDPHAQGVTYPYICLLLFNVCQCSVESHGNDIGLFFNHSGVGPG